MRWTLTCLALACLPGCVTLGRFEELEVRVDQLEAQKAAMAEEQKRDQERMNRLHQDLQEATEALRKGGANLGADVEALKAEDARLHGTDEEATYRLQKLGEDVELVKKALDEKFGIALVQLPKGLPEDKGALFQTGKAAVEKGDTTTGRGVLRKFLDAWPDDASAPEAQFLIGETYFKDGKYTQAVREYQRVHDRYREVKGAPVPKALLRIAECLLKQDDCRKAAGVLKYLSELNPKAPEADKAKTMLKGLKKTCKGL